MQCSLPTHFVLQLGTITHVLSQGTRCSLRAHEHRYILPRCDCLAEMPEI